MEGIGRDLKYAIRAALKRPAFAATIVLIFALGTGANTAIFSLVYTILIRPLPYAEPNKLVQVWEIDRSEPQNLQMTSISNLKDWQQRNQTLEGIAAWSRPSSLTLTARIPAEEIHAALVTTNFFSLLKVDAWMGRTFISSEDASQNVAVIGYGFWQTHLGERLDVIDKTIELDQEPYQIVGVLPAEFKSPAGKADVWLPMSMNVNQIDRGQNYVQAFARMKPGIALDQAQEDLDAVANSLEKEYPDSNLNHGVRLIPMHQHITSALRTPLMILYATVSLVLLIACLNISNLMIVRGFDRRREFTIRTALGASRAQLMKQILTENMLLFFAGGMGGILLSRWILRGLLSLQPELLPDLYRIDIEMESFLFTIAVCFVTGLIFGSAPAIQFRNMEMRMVLNEREQSGIGTVFTGFLRNAFVIAQIAFSLTLIISAALLVQSFIAMRRVPVGFNPDKLLVTYQAIDGLKYTEGAAKSDYYRNLISRLKQIPGVKAAAASTVIPMGEFGIDFQVPYSREDRPLQEIALSPQAYFRAVTPEYFQTLQMPLLQGRYFSNKDNATAPLAVIINEALARKAWPGESAVGKKLRFFWADWQTYTVVGVAANTLSYGATSGTVPELYVSDAQIPYSVMNVIIRFERLSQGSADQVKKAFLETDPLQPIQEITTMKSLIDRSIHYERFVAILVVAFAGLALLLAFAGIYGTFSFIVMRKTNEIGLRMALGATRMQIRNWILRIGLGLIVPGIVVGVSCAVAASSLLKKFLFGIEATHPATFFLSVAILCTAALLACFIPARRAALMDPNVALRYE